MPPVSLACLGTNNEFPAEMLRQGGTNNYQKSMQSEIFLFCGDSVCMKVTKITDNPPCEPISNNIPSNKLLNAPNYLTEFNLQG